MWQVEVNVFGFGVPLVDLVKQMDTMTFHLQPGPYEPNLNCEKDEGRTAWFSLLPVALKGGISTP